MKKQLIFLLLFLFATIGVKAQTWDPKSDVYIDSLRRELHKPQHDTTRVLLLAELGDILRTVFDSSLMYGQQALHLAEKIKYSKGECYALYALGNLYRVEGEFPKALNLFLRGLHIAEQIDDCFLKARTFSSIAILYIQLNDNESAVANYHKAIPCFVSIGDSSRMYQVYAGMSRAFRRNNQLDSAVAYTRKALLYLNTNHEDAAASWIMREAGTVQYELGNKDSAFSYLRKCIAINARNNDHVYGNMAFDTMGEIFRSLGQKDSAIVYGKKALEEAQKAGFKFGALEAANMLAEQYESVDLRYALVYHKVAKGFNDQLYGAQVVQGLQKILSEEQNRSRIIEEAKIAESNRMKQYMLFAGLGVVVLIAFILYRNNLKTMRANELLKTALDHLRSTQTQLVHSEKMASLGELTSGIAHEIQNPLNFVNNFSEVSNELVGEMKTELEKNNTPEAEIIAEDIRQNLLKINHHGKRADSIVKGMLQHSRRSGGEKEWIDINKLADEYLRLAYHGVHGKDKTFDVLLKTDFTKEAAEVHVPPQEIGRVLINVYNNAFYAMNEKKKFDPSHLPQLVVSTQRNKEMIEISVRDNGTGIDEKIVGKIFQPFFTTKPTGQGTGLGLSLAYDIIKAHSGQIVVKSTSKEGTEFVISLPARR